MNRNDMNEEPSPIPEKSSTKQMDSKQDVEKSPDNKTDQDFPGYPHYPAKEDIMGQNSGSHRVDANLEEMDTARNTTGVTQRFAAGEEAPENASLQQGSAEGESNSLAATNSTNAEIGTPQNVTSEELNSDTQRPGTDVEDAAENR
jgi:hypothetical protein